MTAEDRIIKEAELVIYSYIAHIYAKHSNKAILERFAINIESNNHSNRQI